MSKRAWMFIWLVLLVAAGLTGAAIQGVPMAALFTPAPEWLTFGVLVVLATVAQLFEATHGKQSYYPHFVFFFAGVLLLPPALFILLVAIPHIIEWGKDRLAKAPHRRNWYIQPFNIATHIIAGSSAQLAYLSLISNTSAFMAVSPVVSAAGAVCIYVAINHVLIGQALVLARGISWKQSSVLEIHSFLPDAIMSFLGYVISVLWIDNPWLILPALSPLVLMYQALMVPQLKQDAQTDSKTGLWNARHFASLFSAEMDRASRFNRPMSIIMADLDLLRNINNTYGHMAGDVVLTGIGHIIRQTVREYDIAGRFGGEEFAIALPETDTEVALVIAERLREAVEAASFTVTTSTTPIQVTMSIGIASFPNDALSSSDLIHEADVAVYQAKLNGRNCVVCTAEVPHFVKLGISQTVTDRLMPSTISTFIPRPSIVTPAAHQVQTSDAETNVQNVVATQIEFSADKPTSASVESVESSPATASAGRMGSQQPEITRQRQAQSHFPTWYFKLFVGSVIAAGLLLTSVGIAFDTSFDIAAVAMLVALAAVVELLQINVYGESTVSVSVAVAFAAALVAGIPGVAAVSAAISLAHYFQMRPAAYKTAFNWATHVLAGAAPALMIGILNAEILNLKLQLAHLLILAFPTIVSALAYYAIETGLIAAAISLSKRASFMLTWRGQFQWLVNHYLVLCAMGLFLGIAYTALGAVGIVVFALPVFMMRYAQKQYVESTKDSVRALKRMNEQLTLANREVLDANMAMQNLNDELFRTLATIIDARDPYVSNHAAKVAEYAIAIAAELGMPLDRLEPLRQAGFLHDIGKIGISEQVLHKPGKLTPAEYEYVKSHAALGGEFLEMCQALRHLAPFVRHHHERWDGFGYPDALKGSEIPLEARILAVCDAAEAMASDRPYRKGVQLSELVAEVVRCAGTQFDPAVTEAFVRVVERERESLISNSAVDLRQLTTTRHLTGALLSGSPQHHPSFVGGTGPLTGSLNTGHLSGQLAGHPNTGPFKKNGTLAPTSP